MSKLRKATLPEQTAPVPVPAPAPPPIESAPASPGRSSRNRRSRRPRAGSGRVREENKEDRPQALPPLPEVPPEAGRTRFLDLDLPPELQAGIAEAEFRYCTPIQEKILPHSLAGKDAAGRAQTGTGKTAAFLITLMADFLKRPRTSAPSGTPRALIMAPTRELALQIEKDARTLGRYTGLRILSVYGGMDYVRQETELRGKPVDIIIATPGRLLDFMGKGAVDLGSVEHLVIDEADRMLDMGFIPDMRRIIRRTPPKDSRQTMLFSATLTPRVARLIGSWTRQPEFVEIEPEQVVVDSIDQVVYITTAREKFKILYNLIESHGLDRVLVFCNRKDRTRRLMESLEEYGINTAMLSGDVPQKKRLSTLEGFRDGRIRVLVATDVASRGLHVEGISHVINFNLPMDAEDYVHRIGRTGRAGEEGISVSFACDEDAFQIPDIEKYIGENLVCREPEEELLKPLPPPVRPRRRTSSPGPGGRPRRSGGPRSRRR
ncbi:MAG TPA: DEAD/DEAH box helicase [bacterium]|nr:DEAD/DEAH box helicase [bacterium]HPQ65612.1 DEAD/DEAH box helicase [bacterium]